MQNFFFCLVFLSTVSVALLFEVKKIYVIERDYKTGLLRARRQNVPSHTVARIGGQLQDHHHAQQQNMFTVAVSPPPLQPATAAGGGPQPQATDLAAMVDLTSDGRGTPIDYLTPPPNGDFQFQNFQPTTVGGGAVESITTMARAESQQSNLLQNAAQAQSSPAPFAQLTASAATASQFAPTGSGFQPPPPSVQTTSPSNQVHSLTFANNNNNNNNGAFEQFTPFSPTLTHEPNHHQLQPPHHQHQQSNGAGGGGRWELGFDANEILTPPFSGGGTPEQPGGGGGGQAYFQQEFGPDAAGSTVRNNKQFLGGGAFFGGAGGFDPSNNNNKFTPLDAVVRSSPSFTSPSNNNNVYWGTPKTAQQMQPLRPSPTFAEPNAFRFNSNNNNHPHPHHLHPPANHLHQYVDAFHQMPFTGQFDGPLSQGTVADHVVHSSIRIKRQLQRDESDNDDEDAPVMDNRRDDTADNDDNNDDDGHLRFGDRKPVYSYVKTDRNGNFKWSVRHGY